MGPTVAPLRVAAASPAEEPELATRLHALQVAAYRVEAHLLGDDRIPPLHEDVADLVAAGLTWRTATPGSDQLEPLSGGRLLGAVAWRDDGEALDVDRLAVDPAAHRQGVGRALVAAAVAAAGRRPVLVATGRDNGPALALYAVAGFLALRDLEVLPGLWVRKLRRAAG